MCTKSDISEYVMIKNKGECISESYGSILRCPLKTYIQRTKINGGRFNLI